MLIQAKRFINLESVISKMKRTTMRKKVNNAIKVVTMIVKMAS
jgi:hypothetical protein